MALALKRYLEQPNKSWLLWLLPFLIPSSIKIVDEFAALLLHNNIFFPKQGTFVNIASTTFSPSTAEYPLSSFRKNYGLPAERHRQNAFGDIKSILKKKCLNLLLSWKKRFRG